MATSENEDYEYYAYSSDEDGYPVEAGHEDDGDNSDMEWDANENPQAPPMTFARGMYIVMDLEYSSRSSRRRSVLTLSHRKPWSRYVDLLPEST
jgi:hypothetical protein